MKRIKTIKKEIDQLHNQIYIHNKINTDNYAKLNTHLNAIIKILNKIE